MGLFTETEEWDLEIMGPLLTAANDLDFLTVEVDKEASASSSFAFANDDVLLMDELEALIEEPAGGELMDKLEVDGGDETCGVDGSEVVETEVGHCEDREEQEAEFP